MKSFQDKVNFIWSVADLLRGDYKASEYGRVILPLTVLRRLDCVLEPTKAAVLERAADPAIQCIGDIDPILCRAAGQRFYNRSQLDFRKLLSDPQHIADNVREYINSFSASARETFEKFNFDDHIDRMDAAGILFQVIRKFAGVDLHPDIVPNSEMGMIFEELIRRFSEQSNETAGEHFTPREVVRLMVDVLFIGADELLTAKAVNRMLYDPACGTGGMLSVAQERLGELNPDANLYVYGQEINPESYAICRSDMMIKGQDPTNIAFGNSFSQDGHKGGTYDYFLSNPPFGVEWKKVENVIKEEHARLGMDGRFGAGLPRINDGSLLFLQHMISKWKDSASGGSRLGIVFNGSPLFTGDAGSGESNIRKWIIENDWLEAIIGLPDQLFYNTGISTYIWILTNRKPPERQGTIQLVNATGLFTKMRKSLGNKRNLIAPEQIGEIVRLYGEFQEEKRVKIFRNEEFGYRQITVERPLRLRYEATEEGIERALSSKSLQAELASDDGTKREALIAVMREAGAEGPRDERAARQAIDKRMESHSIDVTATTKESLVEGLEVRDESAPIVTQDGKPVPDIRLRSVRNVPLNERVSDYMTREVLPHLADSWADESRVKIGYKIPTMPLRLSNLSDVLATSAEELGESPVELSELVDRINICGSGGSNTFVQTGNTIYIPLTGSTPVHTELDAVELRPHHYAQVVLNETRAIAGYVAGFLNGDLGVRIRDAFAAGALPRLDRRDLGRLPVFVPQIGRQAEVIAVHSEIRDKRTRLSTLEHQLWARPSRAKRIQQQARALDSERDFGEWMDTLPYSLAMVLWIYRGAVDPVRKLEHLHQFFEAAAQFQCILYLSAFWSDPVFYSRHCDEWLDPVKGRREEMLHPSFGTWTYLLGRLSKATKRMLDNKDTRSEVIDLLGHPDRNFLDMITSKKIVRLLERARDYRNLWKGHGGIAGDDEARQHLTILGDLLSQFWEATSDAYSTCLLMSPGPGELEDGLWHFTVRVVMGRSHPFEKRVVRTSEPMDRQQLYLIHDGQAKPLRLLPLMRLRHSPPDIENAMYFFNRTRGSSVRWVSYHFESKSEDETEEPDIASLVALLANVA